MRALAVVLGLTLVSCGTLKERLCPVGQQLCLDEQPNGDGSFFRCAPVGEECHSPPQTIPSPTPEPSATPDCRTTGCTDGETCHVIPGSRLEHSPDGVYGCGVPMPSPEPTPNVGTPSPVPTFPPSPLPSPDNPTPRATPGTCPPLMRVGGGLFNCQRQGQPKPCDGPLVAGDRVTLDSTHHFGRRTVASCDQPTDTACGGRMCDDIVGGTKFILLEGASECRKTGTHQLTCAPLKKGWHRIQLCPNDDYKDQLGQPVGVLRTPSQAECTIVGFFVQ